MKFENTTTLIPEDFLLMQRVLLTAKSPLRTMLLMQRIAFALPGVILILTGSTRLWALFTSSTTASTDLATALALMLAGLALLVLPGSRTKARSLWRKYRDKGVAFSYQFLEDRFFAGETEVSYDDVQELFETGCAYVLFSKALTPYILHKDSFSTGEPSSFAAFLAEKTGHPFQTIEKL